MSHDSPHITDNGLYAETLKSPFGLVNPLSPNVHIQVLQTVLYTLENKLGEFDKRSKHFAFGDHSTSSRNLFHWLCTDFVWRKFMLVSLSSLVQRKLHPTGSLECHGLESCWFFFVALSSMSARIFSTIFFHYTNNLSTFIAQYP